MMPLKRAPSTVKYATSSSAPIHALRFIDLIDFYLYQSSGSPAPVLERIPSTLTNELQVAWYNHLVTSVFPRPLTIADVRLALLRDFGVDWRTQRAVLARYRGEGGERDYVWDGGRYVQELGGEEGERAYLRSQGFKVVMNYIDEIEELKEEVSMAKREGEEKVRKAMRERDAAVVELKGRIEELECTVKGLTRVLGDGEGEEEERERVRMAWRRYREEVDVAGERFTGVLEVVLGDTSDIGLDTSYVEKGTLDTDSFGTPWSANTKEPTPSLDSPVGPLSLAQSTNIEAKSLSDADSFSQIDKVESHELKLGIDLNCRIDSL